MNNQNQLKERRKMTILRASSKAFTLAEVLITLAIIGIVAALTLPSLIQKQNEKAVVVSLKKTYSMLAQAYELAILENSTPDTWGLTAGLDEHEDLNPDEISDSAQIVLNKLLKYIKTTKTCGKKSGCFPDKYLYLNGTPAAEQPDKQYFAKAILDNGSLMLVDVHSINCATSHYGTTKQLQNICGSINIDINGYKGPNQYGKDVFVFWYTKYGIVPLGSVDEFQDARIGCLEENANGLRCAAWVIYNENLDYLHCTDLDWKTKTKCGK